MKDEDIIELYFARDEAAIRETADKYGRFCYEVSMSILGNPSDAEECVNDTYLRTWNSIPPHRPSKLKAFLGKITRNLSIDRYRREHDARHNRELEVALSELEDCLPDRSDEHDPRLTELLNDFLDSLEPMDRKLFMGRYWHSYPVHRLAAHYGLTPNAVSLRLMRLRERLRTYLEERGYSV